MCGLELVEDGSPPAQSRTDSREPSCAKQVFPCELPFQSTVGAADVEPVFMGGLLRRLTAADDIVIMIIGGPKSVQFAVDLSLPDGYAHSVSPTNG